MALPLPSVVPNVGPGGPIVTSMLGANALTESNLNNTIKNAKAQYAPYNFYADAALKMAQAQVAAPQVLSNILSNPLGVSRMTPELYNSLVSMTQRGLQNIGNLNIPQPGQGGGFNNSPIGHAINWLMNRGGNAQPSQNNPQAMQQAISSMQPNQLITVGANGQPIITNDNSAPSNNAIAGGYNTPSARQAAKLQTPGTYGGVNPGTAAEAQGKAFETSATGQASAATEQWKNAQTDAANTGNLMNNIINYANEFHSSYGKSFYKGARLGSLPSEGLLSPPTWPGHDLSDEQLTDRSSAQIMTSMANAYQTGHVSDSLVDLFSRLKLSRTLDSGSEQSTYDSTIATANRGKEVKDFYNYIKRQNPDIVQPEADALFGLYNTQMPPYDFNTLTPLPKNKGQWKQYASPKALQEYRNTGEFNPNPSPANKGYQLSIETSPNQGETQPQQSSKPSSAKEAIQQQGQSYKKQMIKMTGKDPRDGKMKIWQVPQGKVQLFLDNGFARAY